MLMDFHRNTTKAIFSTRNQFSFYIKIEQKKKYNYKLLENVGRKQWKLEWLNMEFNVDFIKTINQRIVINNSVRILYIYMDIAAYAKAYLHIKM